MSTKVEPKNDQSEPITGQTMSKEEAFVRDYRDLCRRYHLQIGGIPELQPTGHGSFEIVVNQFMVVPISAGMLMD